MNNHILMLELLLASNVGVATLELEDMASPMIALTNAKMAIHVEAKIPFQFSNQSW
jgi:hypothetical protein